MCDAAVMRVALDRYCYFVDMSAAAQQSQQVIAVTTAQQQQSLCSLRFSIRDSGFGISEFPLHSSRDQNCHFQLQRFKVHMFYCGSSSY